MRGFFFEEFNVGDEITTPRRSITESDVMLFAGLSGDTNPIHTDRVFGGASPFGACIAHGLLGLSVATGLTARTGVLDGTAIALLSVDNWTFKKPIFFGDTIHARVTIVGKCETRHAERGIIQRRVELINQDGQVVQEGTLTTMVKRRAATDDPS